MIQAHDELLQSLTALKRPKHYLAFLEISVHYALKELYRPYFSHVPRYGAQESEGLLPTYSIARWFAHQFDEINGYAEDRTAGKVAKTLSEDPERVEHTSRDLTVTSTHADFEAAINGGPPMSAGLISHGGRASDAPLPIVVAPDLP